MSKTDEDRLTHASRRLIRRLDRFGARVFDALLFRDVDAAIRMHRKHERAEYAVAFPEVVAIILPTPRVIQCYRADLDKNGITAAVAQITHHFCTETGQCSIEEVARAFARAYAGKSQAYAEFVQDRVRESLTVPQIAKQMGLAR